MTNTQIEQLAKDNWVKKYGDTTSFMGDESMQLAWSSWLNAHQVLLSEFKWTDSDMLMAYMEGNCNRGIENQLPWKFLREYESQQENRTAVPRNAEELHEPEYGC